MHVRQVNVSTAGLISGLQSYLPSAIRAAESAYREDGWAQRLKLDPFAAYSLRHDEQRILTLIKSGQMRMTAKVTANLDALIHRNRDALPEAMRGEVSKVVRGDSAAKRVDSYVAGGVRGPLLAYEFEHAITLAEAKAPLGAERLLPVSDDPPPIGAKTHAWKRELHSGKAIIHTGTSGDIPMAGVSTVDESFPLVYLVAGMSDNYFERLQDDFAGINSVESKAAAARRAVREAQNEICFFGATDSDLHGFVNARNLPSSVSTLDYGADSGLDIFDELSALLDDPWIESKGAWRPNALAMGLRKMRQIRRRLYNSSGGQDQTILQRLQALYPDVEIGDYYELDGVTSLGGDDVIQAYRKESRYAHRVTDGAIYSLPMVNAGPFDRVQVYFAQEGGVIMNDMAAQQLRAVPGS